MCRNVKLQKCINTVTLNRYISVTLLTTVTLLQSVDHHCYITFQCIVENGLDDPKVTATILVNLDNKNDVAAGIVFLARVWRKLYKDSEEVQNAEEDTSTGRFSLAQLFDIFSCSQL